MKRTVPQMTDFVAEVLRVDPAVLRVHARRMREKDQLSQQGHGRGAAAATSRDAALLMLVGAADVPAYRAPALAAALSTDHLLIIPGDDATPRFLNAVEHLADFIESGREILEVHLIRGGPNRLSVAFVGTEDSVGDHVTYVIRGDSEAWEQMVAVFGHPRTPVRTIIEGSLVRDVGRWLRDDLGTAA